MIVAVLALIVALGGTAIAANVALTGKQKKESGKIAGKVFTKRIGGASVAHAKSAETANQAAKANEATKADTANSANTANSATTATRSDEATRAKSATSADLAAKATDAEMLGGLAAGEYQHKLTEQCPAPESISTIDQQGNVTCNTTAVKAINRVLSAPDQFAFNLGNGLQLDVTCHDGGNTALHFQNLGSLAHLSWFYTPSSGTTGSGVLSLNQGEEQTFSYAAGQIGGQFIWSDGEGVDTVDVHALDRGATCEVFGTAVSVLG
jgi:hypothetical protein